MEAELSDILSIQLHEGIEEEADASKVLIPGLLPSGEVQGNTAPSTPH